MDFIASAAAADVRAVSVKVYLARTEAPKGKAAVSLQGHDEASKNAGYLIMLTGGRS